MITHVAVKVARLPWKEGHAGVGLRKQVAEHLDGKRIGSLPRGDVRIVAPGARRLVQAVKASLPIDLDVVRIARLVRGIVKSNERLIRHVFGGRRAYLRKEFPSAQVAVALLQVVLRRTVAAR